MTRPPPVAAALEKSLGGVWIVADADSPSDDVRPFSSEVTALRFVNDNIGMNYHAVFVPYGKSLHDVVRKIGEK